MILIGSCSRSKLLRSLEARVGQEARQVEANQRIKVHSVCPEFIFLSLKFHHFAYFPTGLILSARWCIAISTKMFRPLSRTPIDASKWSTSNAPTSDSMAADLPYLHSMSISHRKRSRLSKSWSRD